MAGVPITLVEIGGFPITQADNAEPMTPMEGGMPCTLVASGGYPVTLINDDVSPWGGLQWGVGDYLAWGLSDYVTWG